jgi:hypothetical protein
MKPIEFWACTSRECIQPPRSPRHRTRQTSEGESSTQGIRIDLYGGGGGGEGGAAAGGSNGSPDASSEEQLGGGGAGGACSSGPMDDETSACGHGHQLGRVHVGVHYDVSAACLYVRVIEARDLPPPCSIVRDEASTSSTGSGSGSGSGSSGSKGSKGDVSRSNSYARVRLLPSGKTSIPSYQTSVQRKTQNPIWEEQFAFNVPFVDIQNKAVEVVVKDFDKFSRHYLIGCTTLSLDSLNILRGTHLWKYLEPCTKVIMITSWRQFYQLSPIVY